MIWDITILRFAFVFIALICFILDIRRLRKIDFHKDREKLWEAKDYFSRTNRSPFIFLILIGLIIPMVYWIIGLGFVAYYSFMPLLPLLSLNFLLPIFLIRLLNTMWNHFVFEGFMMPTKQLFYNNVITVLFGMVMSIGIASLIIYQTVMFLIK